MKARTLSVMLWGVLSLAACGPQAWEQHPAVKAAKKACKGPDEGERYDCIERHAVETLNPDVCRLAGMWIDDMCLQMVYEAAGDPAICEQLYLEGVRPTCRAYYAQALAPMRRYTDTVLGFAAEVPSNWESSARTETLDPLGRTWHSVEFRSELHAYGHQAFNQYGIRVQVGPSLGSTLTETVQLSLSFLPPGFRDQVQVDCCLRVGNEQSIDETEHSIPQDVIRASPRPRVYAGATVDRAGGRLCLGRRCCHSKQSDNREPGHSQSRRDNHPGDQLPTTVCG
jgi:hypothetical protein